MKTRKLALCSTLCALGTALLWIGSATDVLDLTFACAASLIVVFAVLELKGRAAFLIYAVTGMLSLILVPIKFTALEYIFFAGIYPLVKYRLERRFRKTVILWTLKLVYLNAVFALLLLAAKYLLLVSNIPVVIAGTWALANAAFVLFDVFLTRLISLYFNKLRARLRIERLLK